MKPDLGTIKDLDCKQSSINPLGKGYTKTIFQDMCLKMSLLARCNITTTNLLFHNRIRINGKMFQSKDYGRVLSRNSYTVKYIDNNKHTCFGFISWYCRRKSQIGQDHYYACMNKLKPVQYRLLPENNQTISNFLGVTLGHIHASEESNTDFNIVHIKDIMGLCVSVAINRTIFVCDEPNYKEINL